MKKMLSIVALCGAMVVFAGCHKKSHESHAHHHGHMKKEKKAEHKKAAHKKMDHKKESKKKKEHSK